MDTKKSCPSAPYKKGHSVFGKFEGNTLQYLEELDVIESGDLEFGKHENVRATMPCVTKGCINWNGNKCTVPDQMSHYFNPVQDLSAVENCPIRSSCRWYAQDGDRACSICPLIQTKFF
ncbi:hypothetical protein [Portibacter marinus]|uniref:hypothetical protein n=1 Tax=Portibacter marinus TaxID=2898660 RepID=UPI001F17E452|nr:hypothetical protein [Portibacter marinus]